jgi:hypothetical protein
MVVPLQHAGEPCGDFPLQTALGRFLAVGVDLHASVHDRGNERGLPICAGHIDPTVRNRSGECYRRHQSDGAISPFGACRSRQFCSRATCTAHTQAAKTALPPTWADRLHRTKWIPFAGGIRASRNARRFRALGGGDPSTERRPACARGSISPPQLEPGCCTHSCCHPLRLATSRSARRHGWASCRLR